MKTILFPLIVVLTLVFVPWTSASAQTGSSYRMAQPTYTQAQPTYSREPSPYIGPFYPYPQVRLGWRNTSLEWDDGWWFLDFE